MQLFSQGLHLVEFTAKQEVDVSSAHWNGGDGVVVVKMETQKQTEIGE